MVVQVYNSRTRKQSQDDRQKFKVNLFSIANSKLVMAV